MAERSVTVTLKAVNQTDAAFQAYQRNAQQAERVTRDMGRANDDTGLSLNRLGTAVQGALAGFTIGAVIDFASELNALGEEVNITSTRFDALANSLGMPIDLMERLRGATLNVANDLEIQAGATRLMQMGIVETADDMERFMGVVARLKQPTEDFGDALENAALMVSNQSFLRLDSLGISSAAVRAEMAALREEFPAMTKEVAFATAMMSEAEKGIDKLGGAAEAASTGLGRMETRLENIHQRLASGFNTSLDVGAQLLELMAGTHPVLQDRDAKRWEEAGMMAQEAIQRGFIDHANPEFLTNFFYEGLNLELRQQGRNYGPQLARMASVNLFGTDQTAYGTMFDSEYSALFEQEAVLRQIVFERREANRLAAEAAALAEREAQYQAEMEAATTERMEAAQRLNDAYAVQSDYFALEGQLAEFLPRGFMDIEDMTLPQFITEDQVSRLQAGADEAQRIFEEMERLDDLDDSMFTEEHMEIMKNIATDLGKSADESERLLAAMNDLKLSDVFNLGSQSPIQSLTGDLGGIVASAIEDPDARAAYEREISLASGESSTGMLAVQEEFAPLIGSIQDTDLQRKATQVVAQLLYEAAIRNIDPNSPEFIEMVRDTLTLEGGSAGASFSVSPGDTISGLAPGLGMSPDALMAALGITNPLLLQPGAYNLPGSEVDASAIENFDPDAFFADFETLSGHATTLKGDINSFWTDITASQDPAAAVETSMGQISTFADNIASRFKELTAKVQTVRVKIVTELEGDGSQWISEQVRNAGGHVPGMVRD